MFAKVNNHIVLTDFAYSQGKKFVQVYIPAVSALYFGLGNIWGLPAVEQVVGTFAVLATFIGVCLGISSSSYDASGAAFDGKMVITPKPDKTVFSLELDEDPDDLKDKKSITFKVVSTPPKPPAPKPPTRRAKAKS